MARKALQAADLWSAMADENDAIARLLRTQDDLVKPGSISRDENAKAKLALANLRQIRKQREEFDKHSALCLRASI